MIRVAVLLCLLLFAPIAQAGGYGYYRPSYATGSYGYSYSYPYSGYSYGHYPSYGYSLYPAYNYQPYYQYSPSGPAAVAVGTVPETSLSPEEQGYVYHKERIEDGRRFPAGHYKKVTGSNLWYRYRVGYEYGTPVDVPLPGPVGPPGPEPIPAPSPGSVQPAARPQLSPEEVQLLRKILDNVDRAGKP